jgi:DNA polymerase-3 subunit epsilon
MISTSWTGASSKNFLFKGGAPEHLADDMRAVLDAWRKTRAPALDEAHFHVRYVVVDIVSTGLKPETDQLLGIAAAGVEGAGIILPDDAAYVDFAGLAGDDPAIDRQLTAFLKYAAKAPLVTYHVPYVGGFLQRAYKERLGVDFQPQWVDLAWLLPSMFEEKSHSLQSLDHWLELFGLGAETGRRDAMENNLLLARIFQMLLVRANAKGIDTAAKLVEESRASSFLRRTH